MSAKPIVLVADDDPDIRALVRLRLERSGYDVVAAVDGAEALELAVGGKPDVAILDVSMPRMSGFDVTRALRERELTTPVILLTARAMENDIAAGLQLGADAYITKPFSPKELEVRVRELVHV